MDFSFPEIFTAGFFASQGYLNISILAIGCFICAVFGDNVGYWFGKKLGPKIFTREDSFFFHKKYVEKAQNFYNKYGNKTIFLARFVPIVRTFAPIVAGVGQMKYKNFITYNIVGGFVWSFLWLFCGYFLGKIVPNASNYLLPIILAVIVISFLPVIFEVYKSRREK